MYFKNCFRVLILLIIVFFYNCKKKDVQTNVDDNNTNSSLPVVVTSSVSISDTAVISGGTVTSSGASAMISVGVCWDTLPGPTTLRSHTDDGAGIGYFKSKLSNLLPNKKYFFRAFATNYHGTAYGNERSFTSPDIWSRVSPESLNSYYGYYIAGNESKLYVGTSNGMLFSPDTGHTWVTAGLQGISINLLAFNGNVVVAGTGYALYRSYDNGLNWVNITSNLPGIYSIYYATAIGSDIYITTNATIYKSSDNGSTWTSLGNILSSSGNINGVAVDGSTLYARTYNGYVFSTSDNGNNWTSLGQPGNYSGNYASGMVMSGNNLVLGTGLGVYYSKNPSLGWNAATGIISGINVIAKSSNELFALSNYGKMFKSTDNGQSWTTFPLTGTSNNYGISNLHATSKYLFVITNGNGIFRKRRG